MNIEVKGVKLEIDAAVATRIDTLKLGTPVKVLLKPAYGDMKVFPGVVVGFEPFPSLPSVIIAYVETTYSEAKLQFLTWNEKAKDAEVVAASSEDRWTITPNDVTNTFDAAIEKKRFELQELCDKRKFFLDHFHAFWKTR